MKIRKLEESLMKPNEEIMRELHLEIQKEKHAEGCIFCLIEYSALFCAAIHSHHN